MEQALDRSKLEQKDRAELAAIVEAMGGKATSRAKKADLVDQILQLAGVPAANGVGAEPVAPPANGAEPTDTGPSLPEPEVRLPAGYEAPDQEPLADWELEVGPEETSGQGRQQQGQHQQQRDDDGEPGNRRRRRRGRDRNRDRDPQVGAPQGQGQAQAQGQGGDRGQPEAFDGEPVEVEGWLDLRDEGYGFLRVHGYLASKDDVYVSVKQVRQFGLRKGDYLTGASRPAGRNEKNPALLRIDAVNGNDPDQARDRRRFEDLTPLFPDQRLKMELADDPTNMTARIIDLISPIGRGQRGLIVSPPKAGKTTVMKQIARSIEINHPDVHLIVLLVDERPEEVTDFRKWLIKGEVAASTFDRPVRGAHPGRRAHHRARQADGRGRQGRLHHPRRHHAVGEGVQPVGAGELGASCPAASTPVRSTRRRSSSARRATSRRAARSPSSPPPSSRRTRGWTSTSSRSSRAPGTWS